MYTTLPVNGLFQALPLLERFETKTAKGAMAVPSFVIPHVYDLLEQATAKGDCVSPYFLHYMHERGYDAGEPRELPSLTLVPSHRAQGAKWVECYRLYLDTLNLHNSLPEGTRIVFASTMRHGYLKLRVSQKQYEETHKSIQENMMILADIDQPLGNLFCAKLLERLGNTVEIIEMFYSRAAFYPNIWGMQEYWNFLQSKRLYNPIDTAHIKLSNELEMLNNYQGNWEPLVTYHRTQNNERFAQQWMIHAALHGESTNPVGLMLAYVYGQTTWLIPISIKEALNESIKWFYWLVLNHEQNPHFPRLLSRVIDGLLSDIESNTHETNILALNIINYIYDHLETLTCPVSYPLWRLTPEFILTTDNGTSKICHCLYQKNPTDPLIKDNFRFSTSLGLYFEEQKNNKTAEYWYRNALRIAPMDAILQYNLANILHKQGKAQQESIDLFLKAAQQGCRDSFKALLSFIFIHNCLSSKQIESCILVAQTVMSDIVSIVCGDTSQDKKLPLIPWLYDAYDYKVYKGNFNFWKKATAAEVAMERSKKEQLLQEALVTHAVQAEVSAAAPMLDVSFTDAETDGEEAQSPEIEEKDMTVQRALYTLEALSRKRMRNLTMRDRINVQKCFKIIMDDSGIVLSTKGRTSGSRVQIEDETVHLPHNRDRMSPGAQHKIKRRIEEAQQQAQSYRPQ